MNLLARFVRLGTENLDIPTKKKILLTNQLAIVMGVITFPYSFLFYFLGNAPLGILVVPIALSYFLIPVINSFQLFAISRLGIVCIFSSSVTLYSTQLGYPLMIQSLFYALFVIPFVVFLPKERFFIILSIIIAASLFLVVEIYFSNTKSFFDPNVTDILRILLVITSVLFIILFLFLTNKIAHDMEKDIDLKNQELYVMQENKQTLISNIAKNSIQIIQKEEDSLKTCIQKLNSSISYFQESSQRNETVLAKLYESRTQVSNELSSGINKMTHLNNRFSSFSQISKEFSSSLKQAQNQVLNLDNATENALTIRTELEKKLSLITIKIGDMQKIVDLIQSISESLNLLAINASIEAARTGELGRGFAVVATEVSKLSNQTFEGTSEITHLIRGIIKESQILKEDFEKLIQTENYTFDSVKKIHSKVNELLKLNNEILEQENLIQKEIEETLKTTQTVLNDQTEEVKNFQVFENLNAKIQEKNKEFLHIMSELESSLKNFLTISRNLEDLLVKQ